MEPPLPPTTTRGAIAQQVQAWRAEYLRAILLGAGIIGGIATVAASPGFLREGRALLLGAYVVFTALVLVLAVATRVPPWVRGATLVGGLLATATSGLVTRGPFGGAGVVFLLAVVLASILLGTRWAALAATLSVVAMFSAATSFVTGRLSQPHSITVDVTQPASWLAFLPGLVLSMVGVVAALDRVIGRLERSLDYTNGLARSLEEQVVAKSAALKDLEDSRARLSSLEKAEALARLASGVAHDFNNMLTVVLGEASLLATSNDPEAREASKAITEVSQRAAALTRQLLAYSRREAPSPRPHAVDALLASAHTLMVRALPANIQLTVSGSVPGAWVVIDEALFQSAMLNLAVNARDAMDAGGQLKILVEERAGRTVSIAVRDTGQGMTPEVLARAFEPFFTTKPTYRGTGLGLASVRATAETAGGRVEASSTPGQGTEIRIVLPLTDGLAPSSEGTAAATPSRRPAPATVVVAEDDGLVRAMVSRSLRGLGLNVLEAEDGGEAVALIEHHAAEIRLVITDGAMPRAGGREVALATIQRCPRAHVLFISGNFTDEAPAGEVPSAQLHSLAKPFTPDQLCETVTRIMLRAMGVSGTA